MHQSEVLIDLSNNSKTILNNESEPWKIHLIDTGLDTQTAGRILRAKKFLEDDSFMLTYGDGVSDINIKSLLEFHNSKDGVATMTSVLPEGRFGAVNAEDDGKVTSFAEKPAGDGQWINAGFFVFKPQIFDYIANDTVALEREPLAKLAESDNFYTYKHKGFWRPMDTMRDKLYLENLWATNAPWKTWK